MINRMPPNFRFKNDRRNIIRFLECSFSKDEISSNFKLELIILFPEDITEGNYYIVGDLFFDVFDQQFPGFTAAIDIVRTLQEKNNRLQLVDKFNTIIEFFREKTIKLRTVQKSFKEMNIFDSLFSKNESTVVIQSLLDKNSQLEKLIKQKEEIILDCLTQNEKMYPLQKKNSDFKYESNHFTLQPVKFSSKNEHKIILDGNEMIDDLSIVDIN